MKLEAFKTEKTMIQVGIPQAILTDYHLSENKAAERMFFLFILDLYKHKKISTGKAAEMLGISKYDFIRMMADEGVDYFNYSSGELEQEFKIIDSWEKQNG